MRIDLDEDIAEGWIVWRLWLEGKMSLSEIDEISIDGIDQANRALDSWQEAEYRAMRRARRDR